MMSAGSESMTSIIYHLKQQHRLEEFGYKTAGPDPFSIAKGAASVMPYLGSRRVVFNDLKFKNDFTDWVVDLDLTFVKRLTSVRMRFLPIIWKTSARSSPKVRQLLALGSKRTGLAMLEGAFG
jgi:hypothetical protein